MSPLGAALGGGPGRLGRAGRFAEGFVEGLGDRFGDGFGECLGERLVPFFGVLRAMFVGFRHCRTVRLRCEGSIYGKEGLRAWSDAMLFANFKLQPV